MSIDAYSLCPCQSGNKVKFCCGKEVIHELDEIIGKVNSGQTKAALDQIDRTIAKAGEKDCLLVLKTQLLINNEDFEGATAINQQLLGNDSQHVMGLQQRAVLDIAEGNVESAIDSLQDAMDLIKGEDIPVNVASFFKVVGLVLYGSHDVIGSLAHLSFAGNLLDGQGDQELSRTMQAIYERSNPLVAQPFTAEDGWQETEWEKSFRNLLRARSRGQFRRALQYALKIDSEHPDVPQVVDMIAVCKSILAYEDASEAWLRYSQLESVEMIKRVEARAIAMLLDQSWDSTVELKRVTIEIKEDFSRVSELMISDGRFSADLYSPEQFPGEGIRPRHFFALYDRTEEEAAADTHSSQRYELATVFLFGKQTDREARVELIVSELDETAALAHVQEQLGDLLAEPEVEVVDHESREERLLARRLSFPSDLEVEEAEKQFVQSIRDRFANEWVQLPMSKDSENTISDALASGDTDQQVEVYARYVMIASEIPALADVNEFLQVASLIGLPELGKLKTCSRRCIMSPLRIKFLDPKEMSVEQLEQAVLLSNKVYSPLIAAPFAEELLSRGDLENGLETDCYFTLALASKERAVEYFEKTIESTEPMSERRGLVMVHLMSYYISNQNPNEAKRMLGEIGPYMRHQNVEYGLASMLSSYGLLSQDQPLGAMVPAAAEQPSVDEIVIGAPANPAPGKPSKLWVPD